VVFNFKIIIVLFNMSTLRSNIFQRVQRVVGTTKPLVVLSHLNTAINIILLLN